MPEAMTLYSSKPQPRNITLTSLDGRSATIDFGGDEVTYSGDLPVAESAKRLFDLLFDMQARGRLSGLL